MKTSFKLYALVALLSVAPALQAMELSDVANTDDLEKYLSEQKEAGAIVDEDKVGDIIVFLILGNEKHQDKDIAFLLNTLLKFGLTKFVDSHLSLPLYRRNLNTVDKNKQTPLKTAIVSEHLDDAKKLGIVQKMTDARANINLIDDTVIEKIKQKYPKTYEYLKKLRLKQEQEPEHKEKLKRQEEERGRKKEADRKRQEEKGFNAIKQMFIDAFNKKMKIGDESYYQENDETVLKKIKDYPLETLKQTTKDSWTLLHFAAQTGLPKTIKYLVQEVKIPVNAKTEDGHTPLDLAFSGDNETVETLTNLGGTSRRRDEEQHRQELEAQWAIEKLAQALNAIK